jgi:hypothetical protein
MKKSAFATASAVMAVSFGLAGAAEAATIRIVALTGQEAPGTGGAVFTTFDNFSGISSPSLNDMGEVAFYGEFGGPGVSEGSGVFTSGALVARTGDAAPGAGGAVYAQFQGNIALNNAGETAFRARVVAPAITSVNDEGIFTSGALVAREGDVAPGTGGAAFSWDPVNAFVFDDPTIDDAGQIAFRARLDGPGVTDDNDRGIFASGALVVRTGDIAPGTGGAVFSDLGDPALTASGEAVYNARLDGPGITSANETGFFTSGGPLVRRGDAVPDIGGAVFTGFVGIRPALNDAGEQAFVGRVDGPGITVDDELAVFAAGALVAREGDLAPGAGGAAFDSFFFSGLNNAGDVVFDARLRGAGITLANNDALFAWRGGAFEMILREGGLIDIGGGDLREVLSFQFGGQRGFNEYGDIAFYAELGPGGGGHGVSGIFVYEADRIPPPSVVPLPPTVGLMLVGMGALGAIGRRRGGRGGPLRPATHAGLGSRLTTAPRAPEPV